MVVKADDFIIFELDNNNFKMAINNSLKIINSIKDRADLHDRDVLERFINVLCGEIAELMVLGWLISEGKFAESSVEKSSGLPDIGHDIKLLSMNDEGLSASIKSSISAFKQGNEILKNFTIATKPDEVRQINIQVYFWLDLFTTPRTNVPSLTHSAIVAWAGSNDFNNDKFHEYKGENRSQPTKKLSENRPMSELLQLIK